MKKSAFLYVVMLFSIMSCSGGSDGQIKAYPEIPATIVYEECHDADGFSLDDDVRIVSDERIGSGNAGLLAEGIGRHCGKTPEVVTRHSYLGEPECVVFLL